MRKIAFSRKPPLVIAISHVLTLLMGCPLVAVPSEQHSKEGLGLHYRLLQANVCAMLHFSLAVSSGSVKMIS